MRKEQCAENGNRTCFLPGCDIQFHPKNSLHKFCSKECKKEWERRLYTASKVFSRMLLGEKNFTCDITNRL